MATNLASKYASKVDERFTLKSLTDKGVNNDFDWSGVDTVSVYSVPTSAMNDYTTTGTSRYGTPAELGNAVQTMTLTKDRSFTFTIDRRSYNSTQMTYESGKALARQNDEIVVPEIDSYRLSVMATAATAAGGASAAQVIDATNAYKSLLTAGEYMSDNKVPLVGRLAWITPSFYSFIKQDNSFIRSSDSAQNMLINGQVGEVDGVKLIVVPSSYFPANTDFIMGIPAATVAPKKLQDYKIHDNPPGINGWLVEGRIIYDAFVLDNKNKALYVHKNL